MPTDEDELHRDDLYAAWAGGVDGREVIDQLLPKVNVSFLNSYLTFFASLKFRGMLLHDGNQRKQAT